jgi:probable O-glycosylation ligase (exosortase A-associated)
MKQLAFMIVVTLFGTVGVFLISPFTGVYVYYLFAVLRPQAIWDWALESWATFGWSFYVAGATIFAAGLAAVGAFDVAPRDADGQPAPHRLTRAHWAVLLFGLWIVVTYFTAYYQDDAEPYLIEYAKIFVMYFVAAVLIRTGRQIWLLFLMVALALGYIAYEVNFKYFFNNNYLGIFHNGYGGLDNNGAGLMLAMGMPACWFAFEGTRRWWRWGYLTLIPVIIHAVLMTYSRGAMLSMIVVVPLLLIRSRMRVRLLIAVACFVIIALPMFAGPEIRARFLTLEKNDVDESANSRRASWKAAWLMALDHPIAGVGLRNSNRFSYQYGADMEGRTIHSQYLQILADNGFVGLALYLAILIYAWLSLRRARRFLAGRTDPDAQLARTIAGGLECCLGLYCFGAAFLSLETFELPYLLLLLSAQLPVVIGATRPTEYAAAAAPAQADREIQDALTAVS